MSNPKTTDEQSYTGVTLNAFSLAKELATRHSNLDGALSLCIVDFRQEYRGRQNLSDDALEYLFKPLIREVKPKSKRSREEALDFTTPVRKGKKAPVEAPPIVKRVKFESKEDRRLREQKEAEDKEDKERCASIDRVVGLMSLPLLTIGQYGIVKEYVKGIHDILSDVGDHPDFPLLEDEISLLGLYRAKESNYRSYYDEDDEDDEDEDEDYYGEHAEVVEDVEDEGDVELLGETQEEA